jgi:hypothetical protein
MSFGDYSFARGHVGITQKMSLKYTRSTTKHISDMSPRGSKSINRQIRAHTSGEQAQKSNQTNSTPCETIMSQVEKLTKGHPQKMRPKGLGRGVAAPPLSPLDMKPLWPYKDAQRRTL